MTVQVEVPRPLPDVADPLYAEHFAGLRNHRILVQRCQRCGHVQWPPRELCHTCHRGDLGWVDAPARGTVYTFTVMYRAFNPWYADRLPYGVVVVDLGAGIHMIGRYAGPDPEALACELPVTAQFEPATDGVTLLTWTPTTPSG